MPLTSKEITIKFTAKKLLIPGLPIVAGVTAVVLAIIFLPHRAPQQKAAPIHKQITFIGTASFPAISPDGKFLAYTEDISGNEQKVMVKDMVGGQVLEVFRGRNCGGIRWSPDGSEVSFFTLENDGIWATRIAPRLGGRSRRLGAAEGPSAWSPDGSRLVQWSDEKRLLFFTNKTTGESSSISLGKSFPPYVGDLDWSPSGTFILLTMYDDNERCSIWTVTVDGSRQNKIVDDPKNHLGVARWSPRADAVYYVHRTERTPDIWKIPVSPITGKPTKPPSLILEGHLIGVSFTLTNDGKNLAYTRGTQFSNLWLVSLEGSGESKKVDIKQLTTGTLTTMVPSFSSDGKLIAFARGKNTLDIYVMPAEGGPAQQLTFMDSRNEGPVWSPDGKEICFFSDQGGTARIWKVSAAGGKPSPFERANGLWPAWDPGPKIIYQTPSGTNLMVLDPATGEAIPFLKEDSAGSMTWPAWSPDGRRIAVRWTKGPETGDGTWVLSLDGSSEVLLRKGTVTPVNWSADGKRVYVWEAILGGGNFLAISPETGVAEVLFNLKLTPEMGAIQLRPHTVDGRRFVFSARKSLSDVWVMENFDPEIK